MHFLSNSRKSDDQKRLLIVYDVAYPFVLGGAQRRMYEVGRRLSQVGWEVDWLTFQSWRGDSALSQDGINYIGLKGMPRLYNSDGKRSKIEPLIFFFQIIRHLKSIRNYNIVWSGQWPISHLLPMVLVCRLFKVHFVADWWEVWGWKNWINYSRSIGWIGYLLELVLLRLVASNGVIVTDCNLEARRIRKSVGHKCSLYYVPNGIPRTEIGDVDLSQPSEFDIVSLGRLKKHKRVDLLLQGLWHLREHHEIKATAAIIGDGPERNALQKLAAELELDDQARFFGTIPDPSDTYAILKRSRLCVVSTVSGGGGNLTLLEAYGCGLPVIAFKVKEGIDPELIDEGSSGLLVEPVNGEALAANLAVLLKNPNRIAEMKHSALSKSAAYDWDNIFEAYVDIFKALVKN